MEKKSFRQRRILLLLLGVLALLVLFSFFRSVVDWNRLTVYAIDVGQGDATLIRTAGKTMLIDAGPGMAEEALCAELSALGVRRIDVMLFTHPDEDHIGGGDLVLRRFRVEKVYLSPCDDDSVSYARLLEAISAERCAVYIGEAGVSFPLGEADVHLLSPFSASGNSNDMSIVTRVVYGDTAVLLMGDVGGKAERALLSRGVELRADLLKVAHHGADDSTTDALLDVVDPEYAVISCGWNNVYGHPSRRVLDQLAERNIPVSRTDLAGTLVYISDGTRLWSSD